MHVHFRLKTSLLLAALLALPMAHATSMPKADYKVEAEKRETLAGDAKTACAAQAKAHFGMI